YCYNPLLKRAEIFSFDSVRSYVYQVIPETVGQYTEFKDKNGKRVFEGDILENEEGYIYSGIYRNKVVFRSGLFFADGIFEFIPNDFKYCEVIGNIHDNPELLEVGE
ncbi:MAG: YopX family protein, partial [Ruminococcus sp.]